MKIENLHDLFVHTLRDIYFAEQLIVKKLPKMAEKTSSAQLKAGFDKHLAESKEHVARLERVFQSIGERAKADECPAIEGIAKEGEQLMKAISDPETRDAAILASAQAVEHYEITRYGTLIAWAEEMGHREAITLLRKTLDEEKATDVKLTQLAESRLNRRAAA
jgi:ferritin-like metal-binding protein YciE